MASLEKPPIDGPLTDKDGRGTDRFKNWLLRVYTRIGGTIGDKAPNNATYITQTPSADLLDEQALSLLSSGFVKVTTGSGILTSTGNTVLQTSDGGTGVTSWTQGDLPYYTGGTVLSALAKNTSSTRYLSNQGTNNAPSWSQVSLTTGVTGLLPLANGGTNNTLTADNGAIPYSDSSKIVLLASTATANKVLCSGASGAPSWSTPTFPVTASATSSNIIQSDGTNWVSAAMVNGFKNRIINGDMIIDQWNAGVAFTSGVAFTYGAIDRWGNGTGLADSYTVQQVTTGNLDFPYAARLQRPNGNTHTDNMYFGQVIESINCKDLAGQTVTLSYYATAGANFSASSSVLSGDLYRGTGTDQGFAAASTASWTGQTNSGSSFADIISTTRTRFSHTVTLGANDSELMLWFHWAPTGTAGANDYVDITGVQLELGSIATPFERIDISTKMNQCRRYFRTSFPAGTQPKQNAGVTSAVTTKNPIAAGDPSVWVPFDPMMFKTPTITTYNPSATNANWRNITGAADVTVSVDPGSTLGMGGVLIATSGTVATLGHILAIHYTANAELT